MLFEECPTHRPFRLVVSRHVRKVLRGFQRGVMATIGGIYLLAGHGCEARFYLAHGGSTLAAVLHFLRLRFTLHPADVWEQTLICKRLEKVGVLQNLVGSRTGVGAAECYGAQAPWRAREGDMVNGPVARIGCMVTIHQPSPGHRPYEPPRPCQVQSLDMVNRVLTGRPGAVVTLKFRVRNSSTRRARAADPIQASSLLTQFRNQSYANGRLPVSNHIGGLQRSDI